MQSTEHRTFAAPDETREFPHGRAEILRVGDGEIGRLVLEPGWRWSNDVKPIANTEVAKRRISSTTSAAGSRSAWTTAPSSSPAPATSPRCRAAMTRGSSAMSRSGRRLVRREQLRQAELSNQTDQEGDEMARMIADCRRFESDSNCTLTIIGEEDEVIATAAEHAAAVHGHEDTPELRASCANARARGQLRPRRARGRAVPGVIG